MRFLLSLLLSIAASQAATFTWEDNDNDPSQIKGFNVSVFGPGGLIASQLVTAKSVAAESLMGASPAGRYVFTVATVGQSETSDTVTLFFDWGLTNAAVLGVSGGKLRNDFTGPVGMGFTLTNDVRVTHLGRWVLPGNKESHRLEIWDATNKVLAAVSVLPTTTATNDFLYSALSVPITLSKGTYFLFSSETVGGDQWLDCDAVISTQLNASAYYAQSGVAQQWQCTGQSFVPVSFLYGPAPGKPNKPKNPKFNP